MGRRASADTTTVKRKLRTGHPLWAADKVGLGVPTQRLRTPVAVDVAIVGAGISGAFMARELSRDFSVAVFDRRGAVLGSTLASTALLQWELDAPLHILAEQIGGPRAERAYRRSCRAVKDLTSIVQDAAIRCGLKPKTSLYLAGDEYGARALAHETEVRVRAGLPSVFLRSGQLRAGFGIERTGAILSAGAASADPARLAAGLLRRAQLRGAMVFAPVEITEVLQGDDHVVLVSDAAVEIRARHVVFCCGYEFPKGVPTHGARVVSTWALASKPLPHPPKWLAKHLVWEAADPYLYLRTTADGRLIAGGEDEASATRHADPRAMAPKTRAILRKLKTLLPDLEIEADDAWAGAFGQSATSLPLIGPIPGMAHGYAVMGFGGNGITASVIASQIVAAAIRGAPDPDADLFAFAA
jgi:glycine/D-amino acid oxidase-like deaminating enzyme